MTPGRLPKLDVDALPPVVDVSTKRDCVVGRGPSSSSRSLQRGIRSWELLGGRTVDSWRQGSEELEVVIDGPNELGVGGPVVKLWLEPVVTPERHDFLHG